MAFADKYRKGNAVSFGSQYRKDATGVSPIKRQPIVQKRTPIQETDRYKQAVSNADKAAEEARYASSFKGMASNTLKVAPKATADVLVGTPAKFIASTAEIPGIVARNGQTTQRSYKVPGLSPFKSFQSDFANVASDVIDGKAGLGRAAWELAKVPLAGLETGVGASGIARGLKALAAGNIKNAGAIVSDAFLPTNFSKGLKPLPSKTVSQQGSTLDLPTVQSKLKEAQQPLPIESKVFSKGSSSYTTGIRPLPKKVNDKLKKTETELRNTLADLQYKKFQDSINPENITRPSVTGREMTKSRIEKISGLKDKIPIVKKYDKEIQEIEKKLSNPRLLSVGDISSETPTGSKLYPNFLRSGERSLENQGQAGQVLKNLMKDEQVAADLKMGAWKAMIKKETGVLNDAQKSNLTDVLEGKALAIDQVVAEKAKNLRTWLDSVQQEAVDTGLNTGKLENYFPRKYNWDEITKSNRKEQILQHMVDSGQASTKAEADKFLQDFIGKNRERKAGNLEYERLFDIPGYERDPEKALSMYAESAASRITEAKMFGKKDEIPSALINKIAEGGGDYAEAQKVFDYVYKGEPKNAFAQFLLGYNAFTKLSLGFFSNLTQSVNTSAKAGLLNTVKGAGQALAQGIKAVKNQNYDDLAVLANTLDDHVAIQESGLSNRFIQGSMYLFQKVENFNRRTATYAGKYRAEELANVLKADPQSAFAARQLESLGIKVEDIVKGKLTEKQIATAANRMVRSTQFKIDALNLPTMWRTPLGKVLSQFKSFSFMQTKFIRDEIWKEATKGNLAPLLRFFALAPIASYVTQSARNWVNQVDPENEKANPSFRKWDLYRKAFGDIPSDFATQMKYAYDKSQATYQDAKGQEYPSTTLLQDIKNFASPVIGPTGGDIAELMSSIDKVSSIKERNNAWYANHDAAQSDPYLDLKRFATSKIPFVGRGITNTYFPYEKTTAKQAKEVFKEGLRKNDRGLIDKAMEMDPYLINEKVVRNIIGKKVKDMNTDERKLYEEIKKKKSTKPFYP